MSDLIFDEFTGLQYLKKMREIKTAFVLGHTSGMDKVKDKGAFSYYLQQSEWNYYDRLTRNFPQVFQNVFHHDGSIMSYSQRQSAMGERTKDFDLVVELHFNASVPQANGVESLTYFSNKLMDNVGEFFCNEISSEMDIKNRGNKKITSGNGYGFLSKMKGDAILLEPFFGSNKDDVANFDDIAFVEVVRKTVECYKKLKQK